MLSYAAGADMYNVVVIIGIDVAEFDGVGGCR